MAEPRNPPPPPFSRIWAHIRVALLVSQETTSPCNPLVAKETKRSGISCRGYTLNAPEFRICGSRNVPPPPPLPPPPRTMWSFLIHLTCSSLHSQQLTPPPSSLSFPPPSFILPFIPPFFYFPLPPTPWDTFPLLTNSVPFILLYTSSLPLSHSPFLTIPSISSPPPPLALVF